MPKRQKIIINLIKKQIYQKRLFRISNIFDGSIMIYIHHEIISSSEQTKNMKTNKNLKVLNLSFISWNKKSSRKTVISPSYLRQLLAHFSYVKQCVFYRAFMQIYQVLFEDLFIIHYIYLLLYKNSLANNFINIHSSLNLQHLIISLTISTIDKVINQM